MSHRRLWISSGLAVVIGAIAVFAFSARDRAQTPAPASGARPAPSEAAAPPTADSSIAVAAPAAEAPQEPAVEATKDPRVREMMRMLIHNERDETGRQQALSRVRPPLPDSERQQQVEIDEAEAERDARSLGLADSDFVAKKLAELTPTRGEDAAHFSQRMAAEERALLADEYLTAYFVRRYLASAELPNGMPMALVYSGARDSVMGLTPEQRADALTSARQEFSDLPSEPTYSMYPAEGWNHPPSPEGG